MKQVYLTRQNPQGRVYSLSGNFQVTEVRLGKKVMRFEGINIELMNKGWYRWTMQHDYIQDAFPFLTNEQREFLVTGITPDEWKHLFPKENVE